MREQKIAIFDQTYDQQASDEQKRYWHTAIDPRKHVVVARAGTLHEATHSLLIAQEQPAYRPDVIVVADRLQDDHQYIADPAEISKPTSVLPLPGRKWLPLSLLRPHTGESTVLLPGSIQKQADGELREQVELPALRDRHRKYDLEKIQERYDSALERAQARRLPAMFIVAHTARLLLPDADIKIIGVTENQVSDMVPIDVRVSPRSSEAAYLHDRLAAM